MLPAPEDLGGMYQSSPETEAPESMIRKKYSGGFNHLFEFCKYVCICPFYPEEYETCHSSVVWHRVCGFVGDIDFDFAIWKHSATCW